jgi:hypothetical protein
MHYEKLIEPKSSIPEALATVIGADIDRCAKVIDDANIKARLIVHAQVYLRVLRGGQDVRRPIEFRGQISIGNCNKTSTEAS